MSCVKTTREMPVLKLKLNDVRKTLKMFRILDFNWVFWVRVSFLVFQKKLRRKILRQIDPKKVYKVTHPMIRRQ